MKVKPLSRVRLLEIPWTAAYQALPSMGFSRQEYWSEVSLTYPHYLTTILIIRSVSLISLFKISPSSPGALSLSPALFYYTVLANI